MANEVSHQDLLANVLDMIIKKNEDARPGTPLAELKEAIESAIQNLPPLEFNSFSRAVEDTGAAEALFQRGPEIIGWDADRIIEWIETLAKKK